MSEFSDKLKQYLEARNPYGKDLFPSHIKKHGRLGYTSAISGYKAAILNLDILFKDCETLEHVKIKLDEATK